MNIGRCLHRYKRDSGTEINCTHCFFCLTNQSGLLELQLGNHKFHKHSYCVKWLDYQWGVTVTLMTSLTKRFFSLLICCIQSVIVQTHPSHHSQSMKLLNFHETWSMEITFHRCGPFSAVYERRVSPLKKKNKIQRKNKAILGETEGGLWT